MNEKQTLAEWLRSSRATVFFGGAGVSTESGIPDFRSTGGLYHQQWRYPPETILSHSFFVRHTEEFFRFYREKMLFPDARPNAAHTALAELEKRGKLRGIITQNIDGLHQAAGSKNVVELHGSVHRNHCVRCGRSWPLETVLASAGVPSCTCGGIIKPDVVLYEESLPEDALERAEALSRSCELMIVGGTSLAVYPAAGFVSLCRGKLVIINLSETPRDRDADLVIHGRVGEVLSEAVSML